MFIIADSILIRDWNVDYSYMRTSDINKEDYFRESGNRIVDINDDNRSDQFEDFKCCKSISIWKTFPSNDAS